MNSNPRYWRKSAAPVAAALISLGACNVQALTLGKVRVQSALGQSLQAEIDISDLSEEDSKSLKTALASPATFVGMGLEFNQALNGAQIALQRRPNGNRFLKLVSTRPLNDPFIDLVVELSWASGRIVRTYTILLDPPKNQDNASTPLLPVPSSEAPASQSASTVAPNQTTSTPTAAPASAAAASAAAGPISSKVAPVSASAPQAVATTERKRIRVGKGDTAGKLARSMVPEGVSVEQMLVAMLNANPTAFVGGNVNRLRAGAELSVPETGVALKTAQPEARQILDAQNKAFQNLRRSMATRVPTMSAPTSAQEAVGGISKPPVAAAPKGVPNDTLKLSKDSLQSKAEKESMEQIAKQRAKTEASERAAELAKNIEELNQLAKVAAKPAQPATTAGLPNTDSGVSGNPAKSDAGVGPTVPGKAPESAPSTSDLLQSSLQNPGLVAALVALLGLGGYGLFRKARGRVPQDAARKEGVTQWESNANTSFDTVGGQRVDTSDGNSVGLVSLAYPDSQLEAVNELDPVAEAEVYLAYGKDVPAEEILQEGLQQDPTRIAIHMKLLGIYAKRSDLKSFEAMAREVMQIADQKSSEWGQVQEMGKSIDPSNPLYGQPVVESTGSETSSFGQSMFSFDPQTVTPIAAAPQSPVGAGEPRNQSPVARAPKVDAGGKARPEAKSALAFDLGANTVNPATTDQSTTTAQISDRLDATLALAEQFIEIDEKEGARALLEEVIADGSDALRQRAKALLARVQ